MKKRILSLVVVISLFCGLVPMNAFAVDAATDKGIMFGTSGISDPTISQSGNKTDYMTSDYIYFGTDSKAPVKWSVLDADKTNFDSPGMFLLSSNLVGTGNYGGVAFDEDKQANTGQTNPNEWQGSDAQGWCGTFAASSFNAKESGAILPSSKEDNAESVYDISWEASSLNDERVFFLSAKEASDYVGNYSGAFGLKAKYKTRTKNWWLRSPRSNMPTNAGTVESSGRVSYSRVSTESPARPALNLDTDSVLFTSAADGGKSTAGMEKGPTAVPDYDGNAWKLTLKDDSRSSFTISVDNPSTISYTNAVTGADEYLSVIIKDDASGAITHYGRLKNITTAGEASGTLTIDLSGLDMTGKSLYIFNEQYNGDKMTDYASELKLFIGKEITYNVAFDANSGGETMSGVTDITGNYTLPDCEFSAPAGKQFKAWAENSPVGMQYKAGTDYTGKGDTVFYAVWEDIPAYSIAADITGINFGTIYIDNYQPAIEAVTITNTGNRTVTLTQPAAAYFEIGNLSKKTLAAGETADFTIQPKTQQQENTYAETVTLSGSNDTSAQIDLVFAVKKRSTVAFAGHEWWGIGDSASGVKGPNKNSITLFSKNYDFGYTPYRKASESTSEGYSLFQTNGKIKYFADNPSGMSGWTTPNGYAGSSLQQKMESIAKGFSQKEQQLIIPRLLTTANDTAGQDVSDQKLWAVSLDERDMINSIAAWKYDDYAWWTRSGAVGTSDYEVTAYIDNGLTLGPIPSKSSWFVGSDEINAKTSIAVRPALYLDMSSFLFSAPADSSGKASAAVGGSLLNLSAPAGTEKFTMLDNGLSLTVRATKKQSAQTEGKLGFSYSGAATGPNQYISCVLKNQSGASEYYGKLADCSTKKGGTLSIPLSNVTNGTYTLEIFCEKANGDLYTDFASSPTTMKVAVSNGVGTVSRFSGYVIPEYGGGTSPNYYTIKLSKAGKGTISPDGGTTGTVTTQPSLDKTFTFAPDKGYKLHDVTVDGVSVMDKVQNNTYTFKKVNKNHTLTAVFVKNSAGITSGVRNTTLKVKSSRLKKAIRLDWIKSKGYKMDYYEVYRSTKKKSGYGTKPYYITKSSTKCYYLNTKRLKAGICYYYKVRGVRIADGKKICTRWSNIAYRTWK